MGLFDNISSGGLLGLGGMNATGIPGADAYGGLLDQKALQNYRLKNLMLGAGIGLLSQGPSTTPINFGTALGQGLSSGLTAAQSATKDYLDNVRMAAQMKAQQQQMQLAKNADTRAQTAADQSSALYPYQLQEAQLKAASEKATQDALAGAPSWARISPQTYAERQAGPAPQITTLGYDGMGHAIMGYAPTYDPANAGKAFTPPAGSIGQMNIGDIPQAEIDGRGFVTPESQKQVYEAMGGDRSPMAAAALQVATNQRSLSPRESNDLVLQQMVHKLNPNWLNSDYDNVKSINKSFSAGPNSVKMISAEAGTGHLDDAWRKVYVLPDYGIAKANEWGNWVRGGINAPDLAAVGPAIKMAGDESVKLAQGGGGTEGDRLAASDNFHSQGTQQDREAAFKTIVDQGNQAVMGLFDQYRNAHNGSLRGFNPNVIAKRIAVTREMGNDTGQLEEAFKETTGQSYDQSIPSLISNGTLKKLDTIDWSSIEGDKFRNLKKTAYAQANSGNPDAAYNTLIKGGAKVIGGNSDAPSQSGPADVSKMTDDQLRAIINGKR